MGLTFPNQSRAYDATRRAVRFWGNDSAMEASFFVTEDALKRVQPDMRLDVGGNESQPAELVLERGGTRQIALLPARGRLRIPAVAEIGYHRLRVEDREVVLAVSPARCRSIEDVVPDARLWGVAAQLYGLTHPGDVGSNARQQARDGARCRRVDPSKVA